MSTREIAERLGINKKTVWNALNPERVRAASAQQRERHREKRRAYDRERTRNLRAICDTCGNQCGVGSGTKGYTQCVSCVHAQHIARDDRIVAMYQEGVALGDMAARLGLKSKGSICQEVGRLRREGRIGYRYAGWERKQKV